MTKYILLTSHYIVHPLAFFSSLGIWWGETLGGMQGVLDVFPVLITLVFAYQLHGVQEELGRMR